MKIKILRERLLLKSLLEDSVVNGAKRDLRRGFIGKIKSILCILFYFIFSCNSNENEKIYYVFPQNVLIELDSIKKYSYISKVIIYGNTYDNTMQVFFHDKSKGSKTSLNKYTNRFVATNDQDIPVFFSQDVEFTDSLNIWDKELKEQCSILIEFDRFSYKSSYFGYGDCIYFNRPWIEKGVQSDFIPPSSK
jgi:hypothetical protein